MNKLYTIARIAEYAARMLTAPKGTTYEYDGKPVNRWTYTAKTCRLLWRVHVGKIYRRGMLAQELERRRWQFFGRCPAGQRIACKMATIQQAHPNNKLVAALYVACLPF